MDLSHHALIIIDLQQRIVALGTAPHSTADVLGRAEQLASAFRRQPRSIFSSAVVACAASSSQG